VALAFKLEDGRYGQLTYIRIYQGQIDRNTVITNTRSGKTSKVGRLVRMHADEMEEVLEAGPGDIVAIFGVDCHSGDTFTDGTLDYVMSSMHVAAPVISVSVHPEDNKAQSNMSKALQRFTKEDPTFRVGVDKESGETIISGMGELHLEVYIERMKREYGAAVQTSPPQVAYRETITRRADFNYTHKKQTGGSGQYGKVIGSIAPSEEADFSFENTVKGGNIPKEYIPSVEKGFRSMMAKGLLTGFPVVGVSVILRDGSSHSVDSSEMAFHNAGALAFRQAMENNTVLLEPYMQLEVRVPEEYLGNVVGDINSRRGEVSDVDSLGDERIIRGLVPISEMFAYSSALRGATQGRGSFSMEFSEYRDVPAGIAEKVLKPDPE